MKPFLNPGNIEQFSLSGMPFCASETCFMNRLEPQNQTLKLYKCVISSLDMYLQEQITVVFELYSQTCKNIQAVQVDFL